MISDAVWSTSSGGINTDVTCAPSAILKLRAMHSVEDFFLADLEEFVGAAIFASIGVVNSENHPVSKWASQTAVGGAITTNVSSSEGTPASTLTLTCTNAGLLVVTSDQGMTVQFDIKLGLNDIVRVGERAIRNEHTNVGTSWSTMHDALKASGWWDAL